jgi:hypothetical protein
VAEVAGEDYGEKEAQQGKETSRLKEMRQIAREELQHAPRGDMLQQELRMFYHASDAQPW